MSTRVAHRPEAERRASAWARLFGPRQPQVGDAVIHLDHGLARVEGLKRVTVEGQLRELLHLAFAGDETLLVPLHELDRVWRYGPADNDTPFDVLTGGDWLARRDRTLDELSETAGRLRDRVASRKAHAGHGLAPLRGEAAKAYARLVEGFAHTLTDDQTNAIDDVLGDLAADEPMDRLVVGDVGFGKSEVALRAAAHVALSGRQVAIAVPTTILARQQTKMFRARLADAGIEVGELSSLVSTSDAKDVKARLADGSLRVVIGTQALSSDSVSFADLGLVIVDEEQRFGAAQKKAMRSKAAVCPLLTMTATPIPATLTAAEAGLAQVSVLAQAPPNRRAVETTVCDYDAAAMVDALRTELDRDGQAFVVCARIAQIERVQAAIAARLPDARIAIAHGQQDKGEVERAMLAFSDGEADLLLTTPIVESGLDIPNANTMVIVGADRLGLAQLHQLRGRVGRSDRQGYTIAMMLDEATDQARRRLDAYTAARDLGAGFELALADRDQRGSGRLLGKAQAGHLSCLGTDLYRHLFLQVLDGRSRDDIMAAMASELSIAQPGYLPEKMDVQARLDTYFILARQSRPPGELDLPDHLEPVQALIANAQIKARVRTLVLPKVEQGPKALAVTFGEAALDAHAIVALTQACEPLGSVRWRDTKLIVQCGHIGFERRNTLTHGLLDAVEDVLTP